MEKKYGIKYGIDQFIDYTKDIETIVPLQGYSPNGFTDWISPIDVYYEDAVHTNPVLSRNIDFWSSKLKTSGILCGDDFRPRFPDIIDAAQRYSKLMNRELILVDFFWCLLPSDEELPGASSVARELREIGYAAQVAARSSGKTVSIGLRKSMTSIAEGTSMKADLRLVNESLDAVKLKKGSDVTVTASARIEKSVERSIVHEARVMLELDVLDPDIPHDFCIDLQAENLLAGNYVLVFEVGSKDMSHGTEITFASSRSNFEVVSNKNVNNEINHHEAERDVVINMEPSKPSIQNVIDFSNAGNSHLYKISGWAAAEKSFSWMTGETSTLSYKYDGEIDQNSSGIFLEMIIDLKPFVVDGKLDKQSLKIFFNDEIAFDGTIEGREKVRIATKVSNISTTSKKIDIRFEHPDCARPADLVATSQDMKYLSFAVRSIEIRCAA